MKLIEIAKGQWVNPDHIVSVSKQDVGTGYPIEAVIRSADGTLTIVPWSHEIEKLMPASPQPQIGTL